MHMFVSVRLETDTENNSIMEMKARLRSRFSKKNAAELFLDKRYAERKFARNDSREE